jgi:hypothetical protein
VAGFANPIPDGQAFIGRFRSLDWAKSLNFRRRASSKLGRINGSGFFK